MAAQSADPAQSQRPRIPLGFELISVLGKGAYGRVYAARAQDGEVYALKTIAIPAEPKEEKRRRLKLTRREVALHRSLDHERIVKLHGVFVESGSFCLQLELCPHGTVQDWKDSRPEKRLSEEEARYAGFDMISALQYMHSLRAVHRDVKLPNLLIDRACHIKLSDLGLARELAAEDAGSVVGTPNYLAPEMLEGKQGVEGDIWSVGVVFYAAVVGVAPFAASTMALTYQRIKAGRFTFPSEAGVSTSLQDLITRIFTVDRRCRPSFEDILRSDWFQSSQLPPRIPGSLQTLLGQPTGLQRALRANVPGQAGPSGLPRGNRRSTDQPPVSQVHEELRIATLALAEEKSRFTAFQAATQQREADDQRKRDAAAEEEKQRFQELQQEKGVIEEKLRRAQQAFEVEAKRCSSIQAELHQERERIAAFKAATEQREADERRKWDASLEEVRNISTAKHSLELLLAEEHQCGLKLWEEKGVLEQKFCRAQQSFEDEAERRNKIHAELLEERERFTTFKAATELREADESRKLEAAWKEEHQRGLELCEEKGVLEQTLCRAQQSFEHEAKRGNSIHAALLQAQDELKDLASALAEERQRFTAFQAKQRDDERQRLDEAVSGTSRLRLELGESREALSRARWHVNALSEELLVHVVVTAKRSFNSLNQKDQQLDLRPIDVAFCTEDHGYRSGSQIPMFAERKPLMKVIFPNYGTFQENET